LLEKLQKNLSIVEQTKRDAPAQERAKLKGAEL